jgi:hypothetical protein
MDVSAIVRMLKPSVANASDAQLQNYVESIIAVWKGFDFPVSAYNQVWQLLNQSSTIDISTLSVPPSVEGSIRCNISNMSDSYENLLKKQVENITAEELEHKIVLFICETSLPFKK